jgi:hypothetical protein
VSRSSPYKSIQIFFGICGILSQKSEKIGKRGVEKPEWTEDMKPADGYFVTKWIFEADTFYPSSLRANRSPISRELTIIASILNGYTAI